MVVDLVLLPLIAALVVFVVPNEKVRPWVVAATALVHAALTVEAIRTSATDAGVFGWLRLDALGRLFLLVVTVLFLVCAIYAVGYLRMRRDRPNRIFCTSLLVFLGTTSVVAMAQHLTVLWVGMEATSLSMALLLYFNHNKQSLEATWKYLMIGSVGIALALLGTLFLAYAAVLGWSGSDLLFADLVRHASSLSAPWVRLAFICLLVGYGTKMGLAPMHTWKPDAYGEAPGVVGALLAGGVTSCAFLSLVRVYRVVDAAGQGVFARQLLLGLGVLSMATAAAFMIGQRDFKRLLAYSSVEHMGILAIGIGIGGAGVLGALLHVINNALTKGVLFLSAGNVHRAFKSKRLEEVSGALRRVPLSAGLFLAGFLAITGSPPFGPFISEITILSAAIGAHRYALGGVFLTLLAVVFIGGGVTVLAVVQGSPSGEAERVEYREPLLSTIPIVACLAMVVLMGVWIPEPVSRLVRDAMRLLGGS